MMFLIGFSYNRKGQLHRMFRPSRPSSADKQLAVKDRPSSVYQLTKAYTLKCPVQLTFSAT